MQSKHQNRRVLKITRIVLRIFVVRQQRSVTQIKRNLEPMQTCSLAFSHTKSYSSSGGKIFKRRINNRCRTSRTHRQHPGDIYEILPRSRLGVGFGRLRKGEKEPASGGCDLNLFQYRRPYLLLFSRGNALLTVV